MDKSKVLNAKDYEEITDIVSKACSDLEASIKLIVRKELHALGEPVSPTSQVRATERDKEAWQSTATLLQSTRSNHRIEDQHGLQGRSLRGGNWMSGDLNHQGTSLHQAPRVGARKLSVSLRAGGWTQNETALVDKDLSDPSHPSVHSLHSLPGQAPADNDSISSGHTETLDVQESPPVKPIISFAVENTLVTSFADEADSVPKPIEPCLNLKTDGAMKGKNGNSLQITGVIPCPRNEPPDVTTKRVSHISNRSGRSEATRVQSLDSSKPPEDIWQNRTWRGYQGMKAYEFVNDIPPLTLERENSSSRESVKSCDNNLLQDLASQSSLGGMRKSRLSNASMPSGMPTGVKHSEFVRPKWERHKTSIFNKSKEVEVISGNFSLQHLQRRARRFVSHTSFDVTIGVLLLLNAVVMGAEVDWAARNTQDDVPIAFWLIQITICVCFVVEIAVRLIAFGLSYFIMPGYTWNIFDFTLVLLQVCEETVSFILVNSEGGNSESIGNASILRTLRILRGLRILRFVRLLRLFSELRVLVISIGNSLRSFFWTLVLLLLMIYVLSVYFTQMSADQRRLGVEDAADYANLDFYWGNLGYSMLSLFQAVSGGIDWDNALRPMMDLVSPAMAVLFSLYIALTTFVLLNLVTGIFVESAATNLREEQEVQLVNQIRELFIAGDQDHSGEISWDEFEAQLERPQIDTFFRLLDLDKSEAWGFFNLLDLDGNSSISSEEFVMGCLRLRGMARAIDLATLMNETKKMFMWLNTKISRIDDGLRGLYYSQTDVPGLVVQRCASTEYDE